jgi:SpoIID/LytB domain protein
MGTAQELGSPAPIRVGALRNGAYEVVTVPLETYVARVLTGEALPGSEPAALEALAIAIRTYAEGNRTRHRAEGFDLCDQTHCQVMRTSTPATERAAAATVGQVLMFRGSPATVYYGASCGGRTERPSNVWPGAEDPPYLPSRDDEGCGGAPAWSTMLHLDDLQRALQAAGYTGKLRDVRVEARNDSGRAARLALDGITPSTISGQDLRAVVGRTLGWQYIQSAAFELKRSGDAVRLTGHGAGHGVGMCVIGSARLATTGWSAAQILQQYYPGTTIGSLGPRLTAAPPERPSIAAPAPNVPVPVTPISTALEIAVLLPEGDEGERTTITALARRERDDMVRALAVDAPPRIALRFHPTTNGYETAAGQPWFTLGTTKGEEMHFIPPSALRDRGMLERTMRRQLVHLLIDSIFAGRPAWVREGAASHFADPSSAPPPHGLCPTDAELMRPVSPGALSDAMLRARACFERELNSGRSWRDVR